jgi:F0F1-type ATP synthase membrane subunit b/b'
MMKRRIAIASGLAVALWPTLGLCAENTGTGSGSWLTLGFYIVNFAIFIFILVRYAGPMTTRFFKNRAARIRENLERARTNFAQAQELANRAAERIAKLEDEKARIASELENETLYQVERVYDAAREAVARIKRDTDITASSLRDGAQRRLRETLAHAAGDIARELVIGNFIPADQQRLLDSFMDGLNQQVQP